VFGSHIHIQDFPQRNNVSEKYAPLSHNSPSPTYLGCIRSTAQIRQLARMACGSLASYQHVDLLNTSHDTDLRTCASHGWDCPALCSCIGGNGTWANSPSGKNYKQSRQQAHIKQELFSVWCVTSPGNGKRMERRRCGEPSQVHFYSSFLFMLSSNINL